MKASWAFVCVALCAGCEEGLPPAETEVPSAALWVRNEIEDLDAIDFCVRAADTAYLGPVMGALANEPDGLPRMEEEGPLPLGIGTWMARLTDPTTNQCVPAYNGRDYELEIVEGDFDVLLSGKAFPAPGEPGINIELVPR